MFLLTRAQIRNPLRDHVVAWVPTRDYVGLQPSLFPIVCCQLNWGLVLDGAPPAPISPPTADRRILGLRSFISRAHRPSLLIRIFISTSSASPRVGALSLSHPPTPVYMPFRKLMPPILQVSYYLDGGDSRCWTFAPYCGSKQVLELATAWGGGPELKIGQTNGIFV